MVFFGYVLVAFILWLICSDTGHQLIEEIIDFFRPKSEEELKREEEMRYRNNPKNWVHNRYTAIGETNEKYSILWQKSYKNWEPLTKEYAPELFDYIKAVHDKGYPQFGNWITHLVAIQLEPQGYWVFDVVRWDSADEYSKDTIVANFKSKHYNKIKEFNETGELYY